MNTEDFDTLLRALAFNPAPARSRRGVLAALTGGLLAAAPYALGGEDVAAKKKKKKSGNPKKKPQGVPPPSPPPFNSFGCIEVGQPCRGDSSQCCSGVCDPRTSICIAHNTGICLPDADGCSVGVPVLCNSGNPNCLCLKTTGNAGFCADFTDIQQSCRLCSADADCQEEFGAGAACIVLGGGCTPICISTGRTACVRPCA